MKYPRTGPSPEKSLRAAPPEMCRRRKSPWRSRRRQPEYMLQHLVHGLLIQRKAANTIYSVVTNAKLPKTNLDVYISNDVPQACAAIG
jgi:hypothetical protein